MKRPLILAVGKGCKACPFYHHRWHYCAAAKLMLGLAEIPRAALKSPKWCPIDKAPVHVVRAK